MKKYIIALVAYILTVTLGADLIISILKQLTNDSYAIAAFTNFISYILLLILLLIILKKDLKTDFTIYKNQDKKGRNIGAGYLLIIFGNLISASILSLLGKSNVTSQNQEGINQLLNSKFMVIMIISLLFIPIIEELIFRKAFFSLLNKFNFNKYLILISSSILFGLIHVIFNLSNGLDELILSIPYITSGLVLGYIYISNDENIYTVTLVHILNNLIATILILQA